MEDKKDLDKSIKNDTFENIKNRNNENNNNSNLPDKKEEESNKTLIKSKSEAINNNQNESDLENTYYENKTFSKEETFINPLDRNEIKVKIQTLESIHSVVISKNATILDLKKKIQEIFNIEEKRQKIIYLGKCLNNSDVLKSSRIADDSVLHLLTKPAETENLEQIPSESVSSNTNLNNNNVANTNQSLEDVATNNTGFIEIPIIRSRRRRRRPNNAFDLSESFEAMHQNITTLNSIISSKTNFNEKVININKTITPFNFKKVKYEEGQWLDAKDSIDQWIEAQVVHVSNNEAYIHYNGWGTRWDEWIDFSSPRLAPFKTYSINTTPGGCYSSPYPSIVPDANIASLQRNLDTYYYIDKAYDYINEVKNTIEEIYDCRKKKVYNNSVFIAKYLDECDIKNSMDKNININNDYYINNNTKNINFKNNTYVNNKSNSNFNQNQIFKNNNISSDNNTKLNNLIDNYVNTNNNLKEIDHNSIKYTFDNKKIYNEKNYSLMNTDNNIYNPQNSLDLKLLHLTSQLIPIMDRVGRYIADVSLHLSHLITNPNLSSKFLLNNNPLLDETLSCASNFSMYTNEGSLISSSNPNHANINILDNNSKINNIQNSNQVVNSYPHNIVFNNSGLASNTNTLNNKLNNIDKFKKNIPKVNLQYPAVQHANLTHNAYSESSFDVYIHTLFPSALSSNSITNLNNGSSTNLNNINSIIGSRNSFPDYSNVEEQNNNNINNGDNDSISEEEVTDKKCTNEVSIQNNIANKFSSSSICPSNTNIEENYKNNESSNKTTNTLSNNVLLKDTKCIPINNLLKNSSINCENDTDKADKVNLNSIYNNTNLKCNDNVNNSTLDTSSINIPQDKSILSKNNYNTSNVLSSNNTEKVIEKNNSSKHVKSYLDPPNEVNACVNKINELHSLRKTRIDVKSGDNHSISSANSNTQSTCSNIRRNLEPKSTDKQIKLNNNFYNKESCINKDSLFKDKE